MNIHNLVHITGRLTADPEIQNTKSGTSCCNFSVAVNRPYQKGKPQEADFLTVTAWRNTAEFVGKYFKKGSVIMVLGSIRNNNYTDQNGVKHYTMKIQADSVSFGLKSGNTTAQSDVLDLANVAEEPIQLGDLGDFEEIIGDGEVPF